MYCRNQQYQPRAIPRTEAVLDAEMPLLQEAQAADPITTILDRLMTVVSKLETRLDDADRFVGEFRPPVQPQPDPDPPTLQPEMPERRWQPYQPFTHASVTSQWYPPSPTNPPQQVQTRRPTSWDSPGYSQQSGFMPYNQPPPRHHHQDENQLSYGYGSASTSEREPYQQPRQPTCWDMPEQPIQYGVSAYDWQPPSDWPLPPPPTNEPDPYRQPNLTPLEQLNYSGRSYYVQQQGSTMEYHQQLPPQPMLDQPYPQQRSSSGWSLTSQCRSAAPLPADVVPPLNLQHVSSASETVTNRLPNQSPVSAISTPMLSSCFLSFAPVSVRDEAGTTSLTNKSVVLGREAVPEQTISQSEPSIACAPQSLQKTLKDVEVVKMLSKTISQSEPSFASAPQSLQNAHVEVVKMSSMTMAVDLNFTTLNEKFKKDQVLGYTGESNRLQFKSTDGYGEAMDHRSTTLDADARLIPPHNDRPCLSILGCDDKIPVLSLNYGTPKGSLVIFVGDDERRHSTIWCVFDPGGDTSPMFSLQLCSLLLFPP